MKLTKVIEILQINVREAGPRIPIDILLALMVSIEAVKAIQDLREGNPLLDGELLPGETAD